MWMVESIAVDPEAALEFFRSRLPVTDPEFRALSDAARRRAFFVAGLARLDLVQEVMNALDAALAEGETFERFRERLSQQVARAWGGQSPHRLRTIFDTNLQMAYGAGRWRAANELRDSRPYWGLEVVLDGRTSSICRNLAGVVRPADDPFWTNHIPPLHFRCRTALVTYSAEQARGRVSQTVPDQPPLEGFGRPPDVEGWRPRASDYDPELWAAFQYEQDRMGSMRAEQIRLGEQFLAGRSVLSSADTNAVYRALAQAGLSEYLRKRPLAVLDIQPLPGQGENVLLGYYLEDEQHLVLNSARPAQTINQDFRPARLKTFSATGETLVEALRRTLIHEIGHHLLVDLKGREGFIALVQEAYRSGSAISLRARRDWEEYFCECFAAHTFAARTLFAFDPTGHAMIEKARKELGLP
ncbi:MULTISPECIES: phage minor head protein [unclassified Meiothermus]|uniref:phage minor head protein n=1 Tax=unclassified Meiothermus TaxID=370471 RepID=UPI000D7C7796|nr:MULTISPECIES: phage minor head protein [unclassified Meiothermus]PZA07761.1 hypothetical protein DNA98_05495 [Meiothermus sp. Pnk-1]RYM38939.1 hypothetical protein EWH23_04200 [Meiothermus sp. PNK-Is4]